MVYILLARLTLLAHLTFIVIVAAGGLLVLRWRQFAWVHLPVVLWGAGIVLLSAPCPLTPLEKWFLDQAAYPAYSGSFIEHYLLSAIYPAGLTRTVELVLGGLVILINAPIYGYLYFRRE